MTTSFEYDNSRCNVCGSATNGAYSNKPYLATIKPLYQYEDMTLREISDSRGQRYEILFDDEVYQRFPTLKNAVAYFLDFSGLTKRQMEKVKVAA
jgi:hypothetical protein